MEHHLVVVWWSCRQKPKANDEGGENESGKSVRLPEAPAVDGAGEHHVALVWGEVEEGVVPLLQPSAQVVHLVRPARALLLLLRPTPRRGVPLPLPLFLLVLLLLLLLLRALLQNFGCEQRSCYSVNLQYRHNIWFLNVHISND